MTVAAHPEFCRPIRLARLGSEPFRQQIVASETERAALARRFGLVALDRLSAEVELARRGSELFLLRASIAAEFTQSCVITLEPVAAAISESFSLIYGPAEAEGQAAGPVEDDLAFELLDGDAIDVGEAVAQQFSLALPAFPRAPDAALANEIPARPEEPGPLATALGRVAERRGE